jgi:hypothetical protein
MSSNQKIRNVTSLSTVTALEDRLQDCVGSKGYVTVIRALVATGDPAAIRVLASLLDSVGPIAEEAIAGLLRFGDPVIPAMRECVDSSDCDMIQHGHHVLAALGDEGSKQWLRDRQEIQSPPKAGARRAFRALVNAKIERRGPGHPREASAHHGSREPRVGIAQMFAFASPGRVP